MIFGAQTHLEKENVQKRIDQLATEIAILDKIKNKNLMQKNKLDSFRKQLAEQNKILANFK